MEPQNSSSHYPFTQDEEKVQWIIVGVGKYSSLNKSELNILLLNFQQKIHHVENIPNTLWYSPDWETKNKRWKFFYSE